MTDKYITVEQLSRVLSQLPPDYRIRVNQVKNLVVFDQQNKALYYIDLLEAKLNEEKILFDFDGD